MPDVFDELDAPKTDVFDEIAPEPAKPSEKSFRVNPEQFAFLSPSPMLAAKLIPGGQEPTLTKPFVSLPRIAASDVSPRAASALLSPIIANAAQKFTGDPDAPQKLVAGGERGLASVAEGLESPLGVATLGMGLLPKLLARGVSGAFAAHMASGTPQLARDLGTAVGEGNLEKGVEAGIGLGANTLFAAGAGAHALRPKAKPTVAQLEKIVDETIPKDEAEPLKPKEPVADVFDEVAAEPVAAAEPAPVPVEQKVEAPVEQPAIAAPVEPVVETPKTPIEIVNTAPKVKVSAPDGSTTIRATDSKGRVSTQPASAFKGANPLKGADIVKLEAGTIDKTGKFKAMDGPISVGPGAQTVGEQAPAQLAQLTESITKLASEMPTQPKKAFDLGETLSNAKDATSSVLNGLKVAGSYLNKKFQGQPKWNNFKAMQGDRHLALSESVHNARKFVDKATKDIPDKELQDAISNYVDAGGDMERLQRAATEGPAKYRKGYERAMKLTPEQKTLAENLKNYFESRLEEAQKAGILEDGIEDYIHRIYEAESPWKQGIMAELSSGLSSGNPALAKRRVFEYDSEAEAAGLKPIKSFIKRVAAYDLSLNKAIADRQAVKAMMEMKMPDGRPMIDVAGRGSKTIPDDAGKSALMVNPKWKPSDPETPMKNRGDYKAVDHPALRKWKWISADDAGNPVFVQGDVLVHKDALRDVRKFLEKSKIREHAVGRVALNVGSTVKQTMLDLSLFHPVQIGVHGAEHLSFAPVKEIDFTNPQVRGLIRGGLVVGETGGRAMFDEGLAGSSLTKHIPGIGPKVVELKEWIFQSYIPRLKVSTGLHALERNRAKYPKWTEDELYHKTATQMNNAFGELNYEMMGRSKTMQDVFRLALLAPDFLEARARFSGDAFTKGGAEQRWALARGAIFLYVTARILNKLLDDNYHNELENLFSVVYRGKAYGLRAVQGDMIHLVTDPMHFTRNRLNPAITRPIMEAVVGRDEFGRKRNAGEQVGDWIKTAIPISVKGMFQGREKTLLESLLNSTGLTVRRVTSDTSIRQKVRKWVDDHPEIVRKKSAEVVYNPEDDIYRPILQAARAGDADGIRKEIANAIKSDKTKKLTYAAIVKHFHTTATRPMTGSRQHDALFYRSLSSDDKKMFDEAKKERLQIYQTIRQAAR